MDMSHSCGATLWVVSEDWPQVVVSRRFGSWEPVLPMASASLLLVGRTAASVNCNLPPRSYLLRLLGRLLPSQELVCAVDDAPVTPRQRFPSLAFLFSCVQEFSKQSLLFGVRAHVEHGRTSPAAECVGSTASVACAKVLASGKTSLTCLARLPPDWSSETPFLASVRRRCRACPTNLAATFSNTALLNR
jgi:hypothetical protein